MGIFAETAPRYWAAGLPVIPLMVGEKRPAINAWQTFADVFPSEEERAAWLGHYGENNIGLPLGPSAGLVAIDIDVLEPEIQAIIERFLPPTPWVRVGKKGSVRVYRYNGHRTARIRKSDGSMIVEILSKGSQIAIPPSIHPDTGRPYTANSDLVDVLSMVPDLSRDIEDKLRSALEGAGVRLSSRGAATVTKWVPSGARDNAMVAHAGLLSRGILKGERTLMEALAEIAEWCRSFVESVAGDDIDPQKAQLKVVEFLLRDVKGGRPLPPGWDHGLDDENKARMGLDIDESEELWNYERIKTWLHAKYELHGVGSTERMAAMEYALQRMGQNKVMSPLEEEALLRYMSDASGRQLPVSVLKTQLKALRSEGIKGNDHTEIAKSLIEHMSQTGAVKFVNSSFWQWKGSHWEQLPEERLMRAVAQEFGDLPAAKRNSDHRGIVHVTSHLLGENVNPDLGLAEIKARGINFANGFLTDEFELLPHDPAFGMTYVLPYRYLPEMAGRSPMFHQLLHDVWGQDPDFEDKIQCLREAMAATLFQVAPRFGRAICLLGIAHSGKTTIMEIASGLMPAHAKCAVSPTVWGDKFEPVAMVGKLLNLCGELSENKFIDGEQFKQIVEGGHISVQYKGKDLFNYSPQCAHWFASNHMPRSKDSSAGFVRRWLVLEFSRPIPMDKKIERYHEYILAEEIEAIAAWAVEGLKSLKRNHEYTLPTSTLAVLDDMATANNSVLTFLKQCTRVVKKQGSKVREYDLYMEYRTFCVGTLGAQPSQLKTFSTRMKELQISLGFRREVVPDGNVDLVEYVGLNIDKKAR
jgi:putative DNA primase/helicase